MGGRIVAAPLKGAARGLRAGPSFLVIYFILERAKKKKKKKKIFM
jgi:hypothetical protein